MHLIYSTLVNKNFLSSGYILNFANTASKKLSESVAETAQTIKRGVEEGRIDGIIDKVSSWWFRISAMCFLSKMFPKDRFLNPMSVPPSDHPGGFPERAEQVCSGEKCKEDR